MIYFISNGEAIKIGRARDVGVRLKVLQTASARPLVLIASVEGGPAHETKAHVDLAPYRLSGEWFMDCAEVRDAIARYVTFGIHAVDSEEQIEDEPQIVADCRVAGLALLEREERAGHSRMEAYEILAARIGTNAEWLRKFLGGSRAAKEPRLSVGYAILSDAALESAGLLVAPAKRPDSGAGEAARIREGKR